MVARRDEYFRAADPETAVGLRFRARSQQAEIGPAVRLRQIHRAAPAAFDEVRDIGLLLRVRTDGGNRGYRALRQADVHRESHVRGDHVLLECIRDDMRQTLAAVGGIRGESAPACGNECVVGLLETGRRADASVRMTGAAMFVAHLIQWLGHFLDEFCAFREDRTDEVRSRLFKAGQIRVLLNFEHLVQDELGVGDRRLVDWHGCRYSLSSVRSPRRGRGLHSDMPGEPRRSPYRGPPA